MHKSTTPSQPVQQVLQCARAAEPFASSLGQAFVSIPLGPEAQQVIPVRSPRFYAWLADNFYREFSVAPHAAALRRFLEASAMYGLIQRYLERLPSALKEEQLADSTTVWRCLYTPHSLRATTSTLLLEASVDIIR